MNFSKPDWIFELSTGVTIKRIVDGNEFVITGDGITATINGFPITEAEYSKVLEGEKITITADGKEVVLEAKDKKVMFDGKPFSDGENISTESNTVRKIYSKESLSLQIPVEFSSPFWILSLPKGMSILRNVDGYEFNISGDGNTAIINGYSVTPQDWKSALKGENVTLKGNNETKGFLTGSEGNVTLNGKSLIYGNRIQQKVSQIIYNLGPTKEAENNSNVDYKETNDLISNLKDGETVVQHELHDVEIPNSDFETDIFTTGVEVGADEEVVEYEIEDVEVPKSVDGNYSSNMENNSTYGFETKLTTVVTEAYSMSETPPTTTSYPSTSIALIKDKNCTEEEPEVLPVPPVPGNSDCRLPLQCGGREICTKENKCESLVTCQKDEECSTKTKFPVSCEYVTGDVQVCMHKDCEGDDAKCKQVGPEYRCFESQCKPTYGDCESSCDCVEKYNMRKGEGKCFNKQCLCRTDWIEKCDSGPKETPSLTTSTPMPLKGENSPAPAPYSTTSDTNASTPYTTSPTPVVKDSCILPPTRDYGKLGDPCSIQSSCVPFNDLVCVKNNGSAMGSCQKIECKTDEECSHSSFPMECGGGICRSKDCSETFCPDGYGCYSDGQCKRIMGNCKFVCDCGDCGEMDCFKNQCFCDNNFDDCGSPTGYVSKTDPTLAGGISYSKQPSDECTEPECSSDWMKTSAGCYKLLPEQSTFDEAVAKCKEEKGFLAKVDSKKKMEELLKSVLKDGTISAWIGAKKEGDTIKWISDNSVIGYSPSAYARIETDPAKACVRTISLNWQNSACTEKLSPLCEMATGKQGY
ncbi:uncharacterized protein LOC111714294 isoform X3 [Eurytemora carolleeae]|nr:uncharacterized protein LOC111714294 isoform X3 [Eurytemora carolleeae]|eukprot:XP_023345156.1 uncharacterized protein LOC111714294 isoform X3 [Eurytemora affinis]